MPVDHGVLSRVDKERSPKGSSINMEEGREKRRGKGGRDGA